MTVYYLVRAENNETCGAGPVNGGVTDDNTIYLALQDSLSQPTPGDVGPTLTVQRVADAHVRLTWAASAHASSHRIYRADNPLMTGAFALGETAGTLFEDLGEATTASSRYYLVRGVNLCGAERP